MTSIIGNMLGAEIVQAKLEQNTPVLESRELLRFVEHYFAKGRNYLEILGGYRGPLYVLDTLQLRKKTAQFMSAFRSSFSDVAFYYAIKSNNHPDISRILIQQGMGLDVSSGLELQMATDLDAADVIFSGPGKTDGELGQAVRQSDRVVVLIDSFGELSRLDAISQSMKKAVRVGVRLTTNPQGLWRKFGINPKHLLLFWEIIHRCPYLHFQGIQFHTSWNLTADAQVTFIKLLGKELSELPLSMLRDIKFIDIGGGYWPPEGEWLQAEGTVPGLLKKNLGFPQEGRKKHYRLRAQTIETFAAQLGKAVRKYIHTVVPCRICIEPGRWLSHDAMHLLFSVVDKKDQDLVITDAGTNAVGWERFETDYFPILNLTRPFLEERNCNILGSLCTPHDLWGYSFWGEEILVGDILMIPTQGAYTYSLRQNFIKPLPNIVALGD